MHITPPYIFITQSLTIDDLDVVGDKKIIVMIEKKIIKVIINTKYFVIIILS